LSEKRLVLICGVLLVFSLFSGVSFSTAQVTTINTSFSDITITPKTAAMGQEITITATISPDPPSGYAYHGIQFNVIDRNGNNRIICCNQSQTGTGKISFSWIPDITGKYLCIFTYPGETMANNVQYNPCQGNSSFLVDPSLPTPTPTPKPVTTPEPTEALNNTSTPKLETSLNVNCQSSTTYSNFKVNIQGTLTSNNAGIPDSPIQLSYSVDGGNSWTPLTFVTTDNTGAFQAVWTPLVTGTYFLKAAYNGTSEFSPTSTIVHFAVLPVEDTSVFSVASNSTVAGLSFNSNSQELSFKVSGETGTTGYVNVYISKSLMNETSNLRVYVDQETLQPLIQSVGDSWLVSFTYHHSVHTVTLALNSTTPSIQTQPQNLQYLIAGVAGALLVIAVVVMLFKSKGKRKNV
jgi:hypothetical protein